MSVFRVYECPHLLLCRHQVCVCPQLRLGSVTKFVVRPLLESLSGLILPPPILESPSSLRQYHDYGSNDSGHTELDRNKLYCRRVFDHSARQRREITSACVDDHPSGYCCNIRYYSGLGSVFLRNCSMLELTHGPTSRWDVAISAPAQD